LHGGGKRGVVSTVQSMQSRRRLGRLLAKLHQYSIPVFVTLTIAERCCPNSETLSQALEAFEARLRRRFPHAGCVVKREHHRSGVPHFHLLVWLGAGRPQQVDVEELREWLTDSWPKVLKVPGGVWVEEARSSRQVSRYVSSHHWRGKGYQLDSRGVDWGRWWLVWNKKNLPWAKVVTIEGDEDFYWRMHRAARHLDRLGKRYRLTAPTVRFYEDDTGSWIRLAHYYAGKAPLRSIREGLLLMAERAERAIACRM